MKTRTRGGAIMAAATAGLLLLTAPALAAGGPGGSGGSGSGGGGGGGGETTGSVYSDLVIALRAINGTPILQKYVVPATTETAETTEYCVQPVSYAPVPGLTSTTNPVDGRTVTVIPLQGTWITPEGTVPAEFTGACDPVPQYAMFIKEVELERLNLARTADEVIATKLSDVTTKFLLATDTTLESTGRISNDGTPIDASPENAAIYQSLMKTGTIPGLPVPDSPTTVAGPPAEIGPVPADSTSNSRFDAWELAAMNIGAAASKSTPLTLDAVEYYNRIIGFPPPADPTATPPVPEYTSPWGVKFVQSADPDNPTVPLAGSERFVDYSGFSYNRSETFKGSVTWLDVPTLTWKVSHITDVVPFTKLGTPDASGTLYGITAFAQLADDVRAMCNFVPDNTFIPGFYMDVPGVDTYDLQVKAIHDPAVDLGTLPANVFQTLPFQMTASLLNPWGGDPIATAQLRLKIDASTAFKAGDVAAASTPTTATPDAVPVPFTVDANGDLVGKWGPDTGFPVAAGYNVSTTFDVTVADEAPTGNYTVTLELINVSAPTTALASETGTIMVNDNIATVLWGAPLPKLNTQGVTMAIPLTVYSPAAGTGQLDLTITGPGDDTTTEAVEATKLGDVKIFASNGADMVAMPLTLNAEGQLVGSWDATLVPGYNPVTWYTTVAEGALVGNYAFGVSLVGGNTLLPFVVSVSAPESHGEQPPDAGEDTTAPVVTITPVGTLGATASFTLTADEADVTFECMLTTNGVEGTPESCTSPKTYTGLAVGDYIFSVRGTDKAGNISAYFTKSWTVTTDTTPPVSDTTGGTTGDIQTGNVTRTGGTDRIATATALSQERFDDGTADAAVIARSDDYADALAAVPLAEETNATLLLTSQTLDTRVLTEVDRAVSDTGTVYVVGGTGALPASVDAALKATGRTVVRISGVDRYDTAVQIAQKLGNPAAILLATGRDFPDALAGGTAAAKLGGVLLLTNGSSMPSVSAQYLAGHATTPVYALGGPAAGAAPKATALVGADRYDTAVKVAKTLFTAPTGVSLASGVVFADALSGGADAAAQGWPLLITRPAALPDAVTQYVSGTPSISRADVYGGTGAVQPSVVASLAASLNG